MTKKSPEPLSERQREILQAVVEDYIATAEPVGSRSLIKRNRGIDLSPATVRNAMADLEDLGYLSAPHASAGRVPTAGAFRVYVEQLASRGRISPREREVIQACAFPKQDANQDIRQILHDAARVLASLSHQASLVLLPVLDEVVFADIEFVPVRQDSVLAVFVAKSGVIQQRVLPVDFALDRDELRRMGNYLKSILHGRTLAEVRRTIVSEMENERAAADRLMRQALELGERTLAVSPEAAESVLLGGQRNFLDKPEFSDIARMRSLMRAFEEKTVLLRLLNAAAHNPVEAQLAERADTTVVFGAEAGVRETKDLAVVMATYDSVTGPSGQLGIVGPMRMDYSRVIPLVEYTAASLSRSFGSDLAEEAPAPNPTDEPDAEG